MGAAVHWIKVDDSEGEGNVGPRSATTERA